MSFPTSGKPRDDPQDRSVVEAALGDFEPLGARLAGNPVDEPIFQGDAARPPALQIAAQRFRLAGTSECPALQERIDCRPAKRRRGEIMPEGLKLEGLLVQINSLPEHRP